VPCRLPEGELGVEIGDVVEIVGKQTTAVRVTPTHAELRGKRIVQIDGITRANAGAGVGEQVTVRSAVTQSARTRRPTPIMGCRRTHRRSQKHL
jgi:hypothetical protein